MVWSKNAIVAAVAAAQPTQEEVDARRANLTRTVLPRNNKVLPPSKEEKLERLKAFGLASIQNTMDGFRRQPDTSKTDYLEQAEQLAFEAAQVKNRAAKIRMKKAVPIIKPGQTIIMGNGSAGGVPSVAGQKPNARNGNGTSRDLGNLVDPSWDINGSAPGKGQQSGGNLTAFINAIAGKESGGNYGAVNPDSGALGKYQIMPGNIAGPGGWDMEALGRNVTTQQFLSSPKLQEAIARHKLGQYFKQYGAAGAASAWYSGSPTKWKTSTGAEGNYPSVYNYVQAILKQLG